MILKKILNRFSKNKQAAETPSLALIKIPWSEVIKECFDTGLNYIYPVVRIVYSDDKAERAVILQKSDTLYSITYEKLYPFNEDELQYIGHGLHGFWSPKPHELNSIFDTEENAINAIFSEPPFKNNKSIVWADAPFRIDAENFCWIKNDGEDDPNDLCLHGRAYAKIGNELLEYDATVSAAGLYLLRSITKNHILENDQAMLPCCGHSMYANEDLSSVDIGGCPNGIDWSVIHEDGMIKLVTETGTEMLVDLDFYIEEVTTFADKVEAFYQKSSPKNLIEKDKIEQDGYIAFWNEWRRLRNESHDYSKRVNLL